MGPAAAATPDEPVRAGPMFGELIPSGDPQWYQGFRSPHYKQTHYDFRDKVRAFVEQVIDPHVEEWEEYAYFPKGEGPDPEKQVPDMELLKQAAEWGLLPATMGSTWPSEFTDTPAPEDYDLFHGQILIEELARPSSEIASIILTGMIIGLRSVMQFGLQSPELTHEIVSNCLAGDKQICLCMSEPYAGSDVAGLTTSAKLSADGTHYILNGEKKWITGGVYSVCRATRGLCTVAYMTRSTVCRITSTLLAARATKERMASRCCSSSASLAESRPQRWT